MRKLHLWCIPAAFFTICCILNLYGCLTEYGLERCVKPALLPLLCVTTLAYLLEGGGQPDFKKTALLVCGQLFGFAGDTMLLGKGLSRGPGRQPYPSASPPRQPWRSESESAALCSFRWVFMDSCLCC